MSDKNPNVDALPVAGERRARKEPAREDIEALVTRIVAECSDRNGELINLDAGVEAVVSFIHGVLGQRVLVAICEGCGVKVDMPTTHKHRVYAEQPPDWTASGPSKYPSLGQGKRIGLWCRDCGARRRGDKRSGL